MNKKTTPLVILLLASTCMFLTKELFKKFRFVQNFIEGSNRLVKWEYPGSKHPGMHNLVLRSQGNVEFRVLVGFEMMILRKRYYLPYGFVESRGGIAIINTFLGRGKCLFLFYVNTDKKVIVTSYEDDQLIVPGPGATFKPHWWQLLRI